MSTPSRLVTGFNHNVKHKGQLYHVQTEDTGTESAHIVTHLFLGGNIIASKKTSYAELRGAPNLASLVRTLMEEQHKEMLRNLVSGVYDAPAPAPAPPAPSRAAPPTPPPLPPSEPKVAWPWSGKGRAPAPPTLRPAERPSWPAGPRPAPPPLPPKRPSGPPPLPPRFRDAETLDSRDLVSDRSLDEVILRYLSGDTGDE
ncbi:MAG TPA: hypothetical protein VKY51_00555 [Fredinandcohnia sp.]|nr:hypothetical protein [Fredinandcohnia sp.]